VGILKIKDLTIELLPKFLKRRSDKEIDVVRKNVLFMLDYVLSNFLNFETNIAELEKTEDLNILELLTYAFAKNLLKLLKVKIYREYIKKQERIKFIKGKILFNEYDIAIPHLIPCEFFEYSLDNIINRILKYTCYILLKLTEIDPNYRLLKQIMTILKDVQLTPIQQKDFEKVRFHRLNIEFKPYIEFCRLLLSNISTTLEPTSDVQFFSFIIPMHELFEKFISEVIRRHKDFLLGEDSEVLLQKCIGYIAQEKNKPMFRLIPDIIIRKNNKTYIIDTKYKLIRGDISRDDIYQMYIYGYKSKSSKIILIYPQHIAPKIKMLDLIYENSKIAELYVRTIDLSIKLYNENEFKEKFLSNLKDILSVLD